MVAPSAAAAARFLSSPPSVVRGFLFYGTDDFQISARSQSLATGLSSKLGPDTQLIRLHDSDISADPDRIIVELSTGSLFGGTKIIWISGFPAKAHAAVMQVASRPIENAYLIVQAPELKKSHKVVQAFEAAPNLAVIACYGEDRDSLIETIRKQVASSACEIESDAAALTASMCNYSALLSRSEAEKLVTFAGEGRRITLADVEACLVDQQTAALSEVSDHALEGEGRKALLSFERFMIAEQNVTPILIVLSATLLRLHALRVAFEGGALLNQAIKDLRPPVFFKQQETLAAQVRLWPLRQLSAVLGALNAVQKETRLKPALAENLAAEFILNVAKTARSLRLATQPPR